MSGKIAYKCSICDHACREFAEIIDHMIIRHPDDEIRVLKLLEKGSAETTFWQTERFPVITSLIKDNFYFIYNESNEINN